MTRGSETRQGVKTCFGWKSLSLNDLVILWIGKMADVRNLFEKCVEPR